MKSFTCDKEKMILTSQSTTPWSNQPFKPNRIKTWLKNYGELSVKNMTDKVDKVNSLDPKALDNNVCQ